MQLSDFWGFLGVPLIVALVAAAKSFVSDTRWLPIIALFWGVFINVAIAASLRSDLVTGAFVGLAVGLAASGLYEQGRSVLGGAPSVATTNPQSPPARPPGAKR